ncbi:MAG: sigma-70 family RNA polymerase sigma factor [Planctomycetota bacterium]|nr:sigma-70 family RNA polymerase sigma factor [Planctomycetota bacterium]
MSQAISPPCPPRTDKSLLKHLRETSDKNAWRLFVDLYSPLVFGFCRRSNLDESDAGDVTQNVFMQVMKSITSFEYDSTKGTFRGWLGLITNREIVRHFDRASRQPEFSGLKDVPGAVSAEWTDAFNLRVITIAMQRIQPEFDSDSWTAFELTWRQQKPSNDVAKLLKKPVPWVYKARFRILQRLEYEVQSLADDCSFITGG